MDEQSLMGDRYRLLELIGSGGEARVFRARDEQGGDEVAVRLPIVAGAGMDVASGPQKFDSGWVKLLGEGTDATRGRFQVFELLEGETLEQKIRRAPLDDEAWREFIRRSLETVGALHSAGWVHGDLNAENFLQVTLSSQWKLLELPFLRFAPRAERSAAFGSIHSLAPEQLRGHPADFQSDLHSLGCLYYYAAAGEHPHAGSTRQEIVISLLRFPTVPLREKCPGRPPALADWVMKLLERDSSKRCATAAEAQRLLSEIRK